MSEVVITKANFGKEVLQSKVPVIVDFWASWCGPCKMLSLIISEIAEENEGRLKVGKINVDEEPELAGAFEIHSIPTILIFRDGEPIQRSVGFIPKSNIMRMLGGKV